MTDELNISEKLKKFLQRKLEETSHKIKKEKRKKRIIQILSTSTAVISIVISAIVASLTLPPLAVSIMCASSAILIGVNLMFNFQDKTLELKNLIEKLNKIQSKLDYVISCNGNLTQTAYQEILKEFNL
jgi:uncharacterized membrane protein YoaK (UPF0700 family)